MLTQEHFDKFKAAIIDAIEQHLANGGKLVWGVFGGSKPPEQGWCPITCLIGGASKMPSNTGYEADVSSRMGFEMPFTDMWQFVDGFDNKGSLSFEEPMYLLGQELRAKYLPNRGE